MLIAHRRRYRTRPRNPPPKTAHPSPRRGTFPNRPTRPAATGKRERNRPPAREIAGSHLPRPRSPLALDELAARYQAAYERGASDMPAGETPPDRPITLLATAIPRLISLAVAANVLHILPAAVLDAAIGNDVLGTLDLTAAGSLHRCHLALEAHARAQGYDADEWLPLAYEQAADWLEHASAAVDPPALIDHAQQAGRYAAVAIGSLDRNAPNAPEAITDTLAHLLTVCVFADTAPTDR